MAGVVSGMGVDASSIWIVNTDNALGFQTNTFSMMSDTSLWYMFPNPEKTPQHLQFLYWSTWWTLTKYIPWHITTNATKLGTIRDENKRLFFLPLHKENNNFFTNFAIGLSVCL